MTNTDLLQQLRDHGAVIITDAGHHFKIHDAHPNLPKSPVKFRLDNVPDDVLANVGRGLVNQAKAARISATYVIGVPNGATRLGRYVQTFSPGSTLLQLLKAEDGSFTLSDKDRAAIEQMSSAQPSVLLVENAVTTATSAVGAALVLRQHGLTVAGLATVFDWRIGGEQAWRATTQSPFLSLFDALTVCRSASSHEYFCRASAFVAAASSVLQQNV